MSMSNLQKVVASGAFAVTGELGPPKSAERKKIEHHAHLLKGCVDAVNLTDNQTAIVRTSSIACGRILIEEGLDPVVQITCRDRNRIAIQSDVLGAVALGMKNFLCMQGDHAKCGDEPSAKNVNDLDSTNLIQSLRRMRDEQVFIGGKKLEAPIDLFIGAVENPFADPFEYRAYRLAKKVEAGADFIQTQAIFDMDRFELWMEKVRELGIHKKIPILAGIIPIKSMGAVRYMKNNVSGMIVPDAIIDRIKAAEDKKEEGIKLCVEMINHLKTVEGVAGVHIMAVAWEEIVPEITERAGLLPRPKFD
ncbi:MAG: Bifunctional homocysteine S-methyltransferase/5,10-methylenetetrahydrofolate reductase [Dehalococcoidia bacterium]|nr:Bifunctional homocysteine S-methyltransferase/5,10-methylenetetrahydrofolate reductase [Bacillota bacterium]MBT9141822.1 Bifunctional homocysteine S-methyltransferase/5,10-methylenetetrahydrofolate reductase [Bacillota bacterium]